MTNKTYFSQIYGQDFSEDDKAFQNRLSKAKAELEKLNLSGKTSALDLGCGPGAYSLALAQLGFEEVHGVDYCDNLFHNDMMSHPLIKTHVMDLRELSRLEVLKTDLILLMGDTVLYLDNLEQLENLFIQIAKRLNSKGIFLLEFRDFSVERPLLDRFVTTKSRDNFIKNVGLVYEEDYVYTIDVINKRVGDEWITEKGENRKLRISPGKMQSLMEGAGFTIHHISNNSDKVTLLGKLRT
ncbi:MAG: methyltransferase domain-containing protein [Spirochaetales bacterium]|nr:methyltransferase domain-containing protein [Spirochaetales bacterium]